jgi:hypothetical protein
MEEGLHLRSQLERELIVDPYGTNQGSPNLLCFSHPSYAAASLPSMQHDQAAPSPSMTAAAAPLERLPYRHHQHDHQMDAEPLVFDEDWVWAAHDEDGSSSSLSPAASALCPLV